MHAVQYFGYGGGPSGLKVIFIFTVHFYNLCNSVSLFSNHYGSSCAIVRG